MRQSSTHVGFQLRNGFSVLLKLVVHCVSLRLAVQQRLSKLVHVARLELAWSRSLGCTSRVPRVTAAGALQRVGAGQSAGGWSKRHTLVSHGLECTPSHKHSHGNHNNNHNNTYTHTKAQEQPHMHVRRGGVPLVARFWWRSTIPIRVTLLRLQNGRTALIGGYLCRAAARQPLHDATNTMVVKAYQIGT